MGMTLSVYRVPEPQVEDVARRRPDASSLTFLVPADDWEPWEWLEKFPSFDLDKLWDGANFLLTNGNAEDSASLGFLLGGELPVPAIEVGWSPAFAHRPGEVIAIASALNNLSATTLRGRFDPKRMKETEVYPDIWDYGDDVADELAGVVEDLKAFVSEAASNREALLIVPT